MIGFAGNGAGAGGANTLVTVVAAGACFKMWLATCCMAAIHCGRNSANAIERVGAKQRFQLSIILLTDVTHPFAIDCNNS